ncbi:CGNR zinc finger domain-containing protein [Denitrobaculum tricleocarpae]|uniref:Zinc finger CGNR domain-containing protein n=1 Tax=Denitrobaculum tricleocarpae TaxID=2591009 RepID=A0A545T0A8_9PROT|nr:CGNR zinc finger domain-containing protein [Denitrobaculum tricleocarpae]TQV70656.1 hypothetical protein FKG95_27765 [Denitrobaculum tricleocarpae]
MSYQTQPVRLIGGRLCLDFLNTADWSARGDVVHEKLTGPKDLAIWCRAVSLGKRPDLDDPAAMGELKAFRASLRWLFLAAISGEKPKKSDLIRFNQVLDFRTPLAPLAVRRGAFAYSKDLSVAQTVGLSALATLTLPQEIERVEICPSKDCGWLFLDESKNRRRRWCAMETCGNRAKARRHYQRQIEGGLE